MSFISLWILYKNDIIPVSDFVYHSVFHDYDPILLVLIPKKDQCSKCNSYQMAELCRGIGGGHVTVDSFGGNYVG